MEADKQLTGESALRFLSSSNIHSWLALGIIIVAFIFVIGNFLKRKDARG